MQCAAASEFMGEMRWLFLCCCGRCVHTVSVKYVPRFFSFALGGLPDKLSTDSFIARARLASSRAMMVVSTIDAVHLNALSSSSLHSLFYDRHNTQHTLNDTLNDEHERQNPTNFHVYPRPGAAAAA